MIDFEEFQYHTLTVLKVTMACSPILLIGFMLAMAHEDEEAEQAKRDFQKKSKCAKS